MSENTKLDVIKKKGKTAIYLYNKKKKKEIKKRNDYSVYVSCKHASKEEGVRWCL